MMTSMETGERCDWLLMTGCWGTIDDDSRGGEGGAVRVALMLTMQQQQLREVFLPE